MNKVFLIGNLTKDPEVKETPNNITVAHFSVAVPRDFGEDTDFFNVSAWRKTAENCGKFLKKGSKVGISGSLQNRAYEDKDGIKRTVTEIVANEVEFLTPKKEETTTIQRKVEDLHLEEIDDNQLPF